MHNCRRRDSKQSKQQQSPAAQSEYHRESQAGLRLGCSQLTRKYDTTGRGPDLEHPGDDAFGALPLGVCAEGGDEGGAGDDVGLNAQLQHLVKQLHRARPLAARRTRADRRCVRVPCSGSIDTSARSTFSYFIQKPAVASSLRVGHHMSIQMACQESMPPYAPNMHKHG